MGVSRVDFDGETLVDLTGDTVTPQSLLNGYSAHNKAGELIEGLAVIPTKVSELENDSKFITETGNASKTTVTFEQAVKRANVNSGDDLSTAFSKLSKFCEDLKPHAFSAPSSDLLTTVPGFSLDATMGKNLKDLHDANKNEINSLNASLNGKFATVTGVFGDTLNIGTIIQYPSNFTRQNTVVIAQHYGENTSLRDQFYGSNLAMTVTLRTNNIEITPRNSIVFGCSFKIVLMRIT